MIISVAGTRDWSIRVRLTVVTGGLATLVCLGVSALIVIGVRGRVAGYKTEQAAGSALRVVHLIKREQLPKLLPPSDGEIAQVLDTKGRVAAATPQLAGKPPIATFRPGEDSVRADRVLCPPRGLPGCQTVISFRVYQADGDWTVYVSVPVIPWWVSTTLIIVLVVASLLLVLLTIAGAWRTVGRTLAPVDAIRAELAEITATGPGRRVPVPRNRDEIRRLAETANATLDRLEAALEQLRRFTSDASHDLRSPITAARAQIEAALLHPDVTDWPATATAVLAGLDRLQAIVTDLLTLARLDAGVPSVREPVDLGRLVSAELSRHVRSVEVITDLRPGVTVLADRLKLTRLLTNLVDNAERHADTTITVTVRKDAGRAVLEVLDDGAGIAPADRETVFQRFARLDAARSRDAGGTGLGLPIARQIAESHGGTLTIADSPRGARFVLHLRLP